MNSPETHPPVGAVTGEMTTAEAAPLNAIRYAVESWQEYDGADEAMAFLEAWEEGDLSAAAQYRDWCATVRHPLPQAVEPEAPAGQLSQVETGWLIERRDRGSEGPMWWSPKHLWSADSTKAIRFARKIDAAALLDFHCLNGLAFPSEHQWSVAPQSPEAPAGRDEAQYRTHMAYNPETGFGLVVEKRAPTRQPEAVAGEPVAWLTTGGDVTRSKAFAIEQSVNDPAHFPVALYAAPVPGDAAGAVEKQDDLRIIAGWLEGLENCPDLNDVVADGGVTAGVVYQQEAREMAGRLRRHAALPGAQP